MKTKLFTLLLALLSANGVFAWDYERVQIGDLYYNLDATTRTAEVTHDTYPNYSSLSGAIVIPSSVTYNNIQYSVTSIGYEAFENCTVLTSVIIPENVTSIGNNAFHYCTGLTSITIPESVTNIGESAFELCSGLTSITIPENITSIAGRTFAEAGLTSIIIPNSVKSIGDYAFFGCTGLTSITIPESVTSIGERAFAGIGLTSITVAAGNTVYDSHDNCNAIIETATNKLITGCKNTIIPNRVTSIGYGAFSECYGLTSITIPNSVTTIEDDAFFACEGLISVTLGSSLKVIGCYGFQYCENIQTITCYSQRPPTVQEYGLADVPYSTIIYVPLDYLDTYKQHITWGSYDVRPIDGSAVENVSSVLGSMTLTDGVLTLSEPLYMEIYTVSGASVFCGTASSVSLPTPGIYLLRSQGVTQKITVH